MLALRYAPASAAVVPPKVPDDRVNGMAGGMDRHDNAYIHPRWRGGVYCSSEKSPYSVT